MEYLLHHNWLAVLVAAIAYFGLGAIWYGPIFGKQWIQLTGINMDDPNAKKGVGAIMAGSFVCMLISVVALSTIMQLHQATGWISGLKFGLLVGVFFNSMAISINYLYNKKPLMLYVIDCVYQSAGLGIAGIILGVWK